MPNGQPTTKVSPARRKQIEAAERVTRARATKLAGEKTQAERQKESGKIPEGIDIARGQELLKSGEKATTAEEARSKQFVRESSGAREAEAQKVSEAAAGLRAKIAKVQPPQPRPQIPQVEAPKPALPGEIETPLQRSERLRSDAEAGQAAARKESAERGKELFTVSDKVSEFGLQLQDNQRQIEDMMNSLNANKSGLGQKVGDILSQLSTENVKTDLTPEKLQEIQRVAETTNPEQLQGVIRQVLETADEAASLGAFTGSRPSTEAIAEPVTGAEPIQPTVTPEGEAIVPTGATARFAEAQVEPTFQNDVVTFDSQPQVGFESVISAITNLGGDGVDFTSADIDLLKLQTTNFALEDSRGKFEKRISDRKNEILNQKEFYMDFWEQRRQVGGDAVLRSRDRSLRQVELREQSILAEKADTMADLADKSTRYESFVKAQMAVAGIPLAGQAGTTMLMNSLGKWNRSVSATREGFNQQLQEVHNQSINIIEGYADKLMEFNFNIDKQELGKIDELTNQWNQLDDNLLLNDNQIQMQQTQALGQFFDSKQQQQAAQQQAIREEQQKAQDRLFETQKSAIESIGFVPTIGVDGSVVPLTDGAGNPVQSLDAQKSYAEMSKGTPKWNPDSESWDVFDNSGRRISFSNENLYSGTQLGGLERTPGQGNSYAIGDTQFAVGERYEGAGECVGFVRQFVPDLPQGLFTINDKLNVANSTNLEEGSIVFFNIGDGKNLVHNPATGETASSGHAARVTKIHADGTFDMIEANLDGNNTISERTRVSMTEIARDASGKPGIYNGKSAEFAFEPSAGFAENGQPFEEFGAGPAPFQLSSTAEAVLNGTVTYKDALVSLKGKKRERMIAELNSADFKAALDQEMKLKKGEIFRGLDKSFELLGKVPAGGRGFVQGKISNILGREKTNPEIAMFQAFTFTLGMKLTRLFEKGRISDADRTFYLALMPNLRQSPEAAKASILGLKLSLGELLDEPIPDLPANTGLDKQQAVDDYAKQWGMSANEAQDYLESMDAFGEQR